MQAKGTWDEQEIDTFQKLKCLKRRIMLILADPDTGLPVSLFPNNGVGLDRMEFSSLTIRSEFTPDGPA